jgi:hypothetical protein
MIVVNAFSVENVTFVEGEIIHAESVNEQFSRVSTFVSNYGMNLSFETFVHGEKIRSNALYNNINKLKVLVPLLDVNLEENITATYFNNIFNNFLNLFEGKYHANSCQVLLDKGNSISGYYGLDFDSFNLGNKPVITYCNFDIDDKGWSMFANINKDDVLWNAFSNDKNINRSNFTDTFGIALSKFSNRIDGKDLELIIEVDGVIKDIIYFGNDMSKSFNDNLSTGSSVAIGDGFFYRNSQETSYTRCETNIISGNDSWNWTISDQNATSCGSYNGQGGFIVHGGSSSNTASRIYGLNEYSSFSNFSNIKFYVRRNTLSYPISCQHGYSLGEITSTGLYNIDVNSDGISQSLYCSVSGVTAYTGYLNAGNNTRFSSNKTVLNNGVVINSKAGFENKGFVTNMTSWNNSDYLPNNGYTTMFLGGPSVGRIYIRAPKWGGKVYTNYLSRNGNGNYVRFRVRGSTRDNYYGTVHNNQGTTVTVSYVYRNTDYLEWQEYPSSVLGIYWIYIK